jgi:hypothetical protein
LNRNTIIARYSGDPDYAPSTSSPFMQLVSTAPGTGTPALTISAARESHKRWRESNSVARFSRRARGRHELPVGTTFSFALSLPASVDLAFTHTVRGQRIGRRCLSLGTRRQHVAVQFRACRREVTAAALPFLGHRGTNSVEFAGRISRATKLRPGRYTLLITARDATASTRAQPLGFTIAKR